MPSAAYGMLPVPRAVETILSRTWVLPSETVSYDAALQRVISSDVASPVPVPSYRASIKDGYAVRSSDGPGSYPVAFEAFAGCAPGLLPSSSVAYVGTGGPVPEGADAVVQVEDVEFLGVKEGSDGRAWIQYSRSLVSGEDVRQIGSDVAQGEVVLPAGTLVGPAEVGILASVGAVRVPVYRRPRVGVLSTGDEVYPPESSSVPVGGVRDANRAALLALSRSAGAETIDLGIARDEREATRAAVQRALDADLDVLLISGGVSMGAKDHVKPVLEERAAKVHFGKVKMKPGKPLTFAEIPKQAQPSSDATETVKAEKVPEPGACLLAFGLPGNPVSSVVTFQLAVLPALRKLAGWASPQLRRVHVTTADAIKLDPVRPEYRRAVARWEPDEVPSPAARDASGSQLRAGKLVAASTGGQISSRMLSLRSANVLLEIPTGTGAIPAGTVVSALVVGDLAAAPYVDNVPTTPGF